MNINEMLEAVTKLNDIIVEKNGGEDYFRNEDFVLPWEFHSCGFFNFISYQDITIYKDYEDERKIVKDDYEPLITYLCRKANEINGFFCIDYSVVETH